MLGGFNSKFQTYEGIISGSQIKQLISMVNTSNQNNNGTELIITINNIKSYQYQFNGGSSKKYNVKIEYENGIVSNINIYNNGEEELSDYTIRKTEEESSSYLFVIDELLSKDDIKTLSNNLEEKYNTEKNTNNIKDIERERYMQFLMNKAKENQEKEENNINYNNIISFIFGKKLNRYNNIYTIKTRYKNK